MWMQPDTYGHPVQQINGRKASGTFRIKCHFLILSNAAPNDAAVNQWSSSSSRDWGDTIRNKDMRKSTSGKVRRIRIIQSRHHSRMWWSHQQIWSGRAFFHSTESPSAHSINVEEYRAHVSSSLRRERCLPSVWKINDLVNAVQAVLWLIHHYHFGRLAAQSTNISYSAMIIIGGIYNSCSNYFFIIVNVNK